MRCDTPIASQHVYERPQNNVEWLLSQLALFEESNEDDCRLTASIVATQFQRLPLTDFYNTSGELNVAIHMALPSHKSDFQCHSY